MCFPLESSTRSPWDLSCESFRAPQACGNGPARRDKASHGSHHLTRFRRHVRGIHSHHCTQVDEPASPGCKMADCLSIDIHCSQYACIQVNQNSERRHMPSPCRQVSSRIAQSTACVYCLRTSVCDTAQLLCIALGRAGQHLPWTIVNVFAEASGTEQPCARTEASKE